MSRLRSLVILALAATSCASTTSDTGANDASVQVDVPLADVPTGPCRWTALAPVDPVVAPDARDDVIDALPVGDGVAIAVQDHDGIGLVRLDALGHPTGGRLSLGPLMFGSEAGVSLSLDASGRTLAALVEDTRCHLVTLPLPGGSPHDIDIDPHTGGFSLGGCRNLLATPDGYSYLAEEIRALWGLEQVNLDAHGAVVASRVLPVPMVPPGVPYTRVMLADGSVLLEWAESAAARVSVRLAHHTADARTIDATQGFDEPWTVGNARLVARLIALDRGALVVWEPVADSLGPVTTLAARPVDASGRPAGATTTRSDLAPGYRPGALSGTFARDTVLLTASLVDAAAHALALVVLPTRVDGTPAGNMLTLPVAPLGDVRRTHIVATRDGAMFVASVSTDPGSSPRVVAIPLRCVP